MNKVEFDAVKKLENIDRYEFFIAMVVDVRDIWILVNENEEFLKIDVEDGSAEVLPVWPSSEFAQDYCKGLNEPLTPKSVALPQFFLKWVPGLDGDDVKVGVFPGPGSQVWLMEPSELMADLKDELSSSFK